MRDRIKPVSMDDFFTLNSGKYSYEEFAEKVYVIIHSYYLTAQGKIKVEMGKTWDREFGVYMTDETFEYMLVNEPIMLRDVIVDQTRSKQEIKSNKYLEKSIVSFEFDLWMIENQRIGNELKLADFEKYISAKYGRFLDERFRAFKKFDLKHINSFEKIAKELDPYYSEILELFNLIVSNNKMRINFEKESTGRTDAVSSKKVETIDKKPDYKVEVKSSQPAKVIDKTVDLATKISTNQAQDSTIDEAKLKTEIKKEIEKDYKLILKDKDDRIESLEKDIKDFKRQRDEAREYSANQYDRGIKDLFASLNDPRYGKVIDYFYSLLKNDNIDANLASYLDNFFMAMEDMEIEPIITEETVNVKEETMLKDFNLDFNKSNYSAERVKLKYAGWTYKDVTLEKPTITLKED